MDIKDFNLDAGFLAEVGLDQLPAGEQPAMLEYIKEQLVMHVGQVLAQKLSAEALAEFTELAEKKDSVQILAFLQTKVPDYKEILVQEIRVFKQQVKAEAPAILKRSAAKDDQG